MPRPWHPAMGYEPVTCRVTCRPLWVGMPSPYHRDGCCPLVPEPRTSPLAFTCRPRAVGMASGDFFGSFPSQAHAHAWLDGTRAVTGIIPLGRGVPKGSH